MFEMYIAPPLLFTSNSGPDLFFNVLIIQVWIFLRVMSWLTYFLSVSSNGIFGEKKQEVKIFYINWIDYLLICARIMLLAHDLQNLFYRLKSKVSI